MPIFLRRVSDDRLAELARRAESSRYTYDDTGMTAVDEPPDGYRMERREVALASVAGDHPEDAGLTEVFERAVGGLRSWQAHLGAGLRVAPPGSPVAMGQVVAVAAQLLGTTVVAPCRVVYVVEEADRFAFAYGTLDGHPECGEERFEVRRTAAEVCFEVKAYSFPTHPLARIGSPVANRLQARATRRYLEALRRFATRGSEGAGSA